MGLQLIVLLLYRFSEGQSRHLITGGIITHTLARGHSQAVVAFDIPPRPAMLEIRKKGGDPMIKSEIREVAEA